MRWPVHLLLAGGLTYFASIYTYVKYAIRRFDPIAIDLSQSEGDLFVLQGFAPMESWGRWTTDAKGVVTFHRFLPPKFRLTIGMQGFGPNVNRALKIKIGTEEREVLIPEKMQNASIEFSQVESGVNQILFFIPDPKSPQELKINSDARKLGVGIKDLRLEII